MANPRKISNIKSLFTNLAQTSHYEVSFGGIPPQLKSYLNARGITDRFIAEDSGLLCCTGVLPTTQIATVDVSGNYMGMTETFAHRRQYQDISLEFYVDSNYNSLKFLEHWMEFIASGAQTNISQNVDVGYFIRMQYPETYKSNRTRIIKFDRDYNKEIEYTFIGLYPYSISSIPVSYNASNILKMQANFKIDRYVIGKSASIDIAQGNNNNVETGPVRPQTGQAESQQSKSEDSQLLIPRSPGSIPSNGVELIPANKTLYEYLHGPKN